MPDLPFIPVMVLVAESTIRVVFALVILLRRPSDSSARLAWVVVVLLIPVAGAIAYLLVGDVRLGRRRIARHRDVVLRRSASIRPKGAEAAASNSELPVPFGQIASLAESVGDNLPMKGNELTLLGDTNAVIDAMIEDIRAAREHVHIISYIYLNDETGRRIAAALLEAEARGVQCRVLVDDVGSRDFLGCNLCEEMRTAGVQVVAALPANPLRALFHRVDLRNHRKITVIDGLVGYTGSQNIADAAFAPRRRYAPWVDAMVRLRGPVVVDLQLLFIEDWFLDTDEWLDDAVKETEPIEGGMIAQVIGTGPNTFHHAMRSVFQAAIHLAREEIVLTTPYFVPDESMVTALRTGARRGVTIHLVLPKHNDAPLVGAASRGFFELLLESGVRIHEFKAGLLHAKTMTVDRALAMVSSANLDKRSFFLNFEASLIVYDSDFASQLRFLQTSYMERSTELDAEVWERRIWPKRLLHNAAGMLSPVL